MRNGTGRTPLCSVHRIAVQEAARPQPAVASVFEVASEMFDDFLAGRMFDDFLAGRKIQFDPSQLGDVASKIVGDIAQAWGMGGGYTTYHPPLVNDDEIDSQHQAPPRGQQRQQRRGFYEEPSQADCEAAELAAQMPRARATLGFGPQDLITTQTLKARFRQLAKKHHPDLGGNPERMKEISAANDVLEKWIARESRESSSAASG